MHKTIFKLGNFIRRPLVNKYYREFIENDSKTVAELEDRQNFALKQLISFCFDNIPYYQRLFKDLGLTKDDIKTTADLQIIPILTRTEIKKNPESFYPVNVPVKFVNNATGGSTGMPLKYRLSNDCLNRGVAIALRGWGYGGYLPGDKIAKMGGGSLVSDTGKDILKKKAQDFVLNMRRYSSYGVDATMLNKYIKHLNQWLPSYIYGYPSFIYILARHIEDNGIALKCNVKAVFSTAEVLWPHNANVIARVFHAEVFDNYGLNDGGISAHECRMHNGMHIDYERSIMHTVDDTGSVVHGKVGRIIATSLYNYAMPFIRYDTGDLGFINKSVRCACGIKRPILQQVYGRTTDYLKLNNKIIGSPILTVLMGKVNVENYQIKQINSAEIDIKYVKDSFMDIKDEDLIRRAFSLNVGSIKINFIKVKPKEILSINKHKFIINEVCL